MMNNTTKCNRCKSTKLNTQFSNTQLTKKSNPASTSSSIKPTHLYAHQDGRWVACMNNQVPLTYIERGIKRNKMMITAAILRIQWMLMTVNWKLLHSKDVAVTEMWEQPYIRIHVRCYNDMAGGGTLSHSNSKHHPLSETQQFILHNQ